MTYTVAPAGDNPWVEADYRTLQHGHGDGVLSPVFTVSPTALQVRASGQDRNIRIFPGNARVGGALFRAVAGIPEAPGAGFAVQLALPAVTNGRYRTDLVVLRYDPAQPDDTRIRPLVVTGVESSTASGAASPNPARTDDGAYDLILGIVRGLGSRAVTDADIEDTRSIMSVRHYRPGKNLQSQNWYSPGDEMVFPNGEIWRRSEEGAWVQPVGKGALLDVVEGEFVSYTAVRHPNSNYHLFDGGIRTLAIANLPNYDRATRLSVDTLFRAGPYGGDTATAISFIVRADDPASGRIVGNIMVDSAAERVTQQRQLTTGPSPWALGPAARRVFLTSDRTVGSARGEIGLPARHFRVSVWAQ